MIFGVVGVSELSGRRETRSINDTEVVGKLDGRIRYRVSFAFSMLYDLVNNPLSQFHEHSNTKHTSNYTCTETQQ